MKKCSGTGIGHRRGIILVELLVAAVVAAFFLGSLFHGVLSLQRCVARWDRSMRMRQVLTATLFHVSRDLRMAGCNPWEDEPIQAVEWGSAGGAEGRSFTLWMDKRGQHPDSWPDGDAEDPDERIEYRWDAVDDVLRRNGQPVLSSVHENPWKTPFFRLEEKNGIGLAEITVSVSEQSESRALSARVCIRNPL